MIAVALLGVLLRLAVPNLRDFLATQRVKTVAYETVAALNLARTEAIKRSASVTLTATTSGTSQSWTLSAPGGGGTLQVWAIPAGAKVTSGFSNVTFNSDGRASAGTSITVCNDPATAQIKQRIVTLDASGRPNLKVGNACA